VQWASFVPGVQGDSVHEVQCTWPIGAESGEGPCWSAREEALWFVDIERQCMHRFHPATGAHRTWPAPSKVSFILPCCDGDFVIGMQGMLGRFAPETGHIESLLTLERDLPHNRLNDACVDPSGRLWFGSMDDRQQDPHGVLYRWNGKSAPISCDDGYIISNGPAFSPDGRILYHTDSLSRVIYRFDVGEDGHLSHKKQFIEIAREAGCPDGSTVDVEGYVWVALYGGATVRRYSPDGKLVAAVSLPCPNVAKLAFGGKDLKTAFVTTARNRLAGKGHPVHQHEGGLFCFRVDVPGLPQQCVVR